MAIAVEPTQEVRDGTPADDAGLDGALEQVGQAFLVIAFSDFLGDVEITCRQALEQVVGNLSACSLGLFNVGRDVPVRLAEQSAQRCGRLRMAKKAHRASLSATQLWPPPVVMRPTTSAPSRQAA